MKVIDKIIGSFLLFLCSLFKKKSVQPKVVNNILIIKLIAMGDMLVIGPLVKTVRDAYPQAAIHLLTTKRVKSVVENMSLYEQVHYLDFNWKFPFSFFANIRNLIKINFDLVLELEFYYRLTTLLACLIKPKFVLGFDLQKVRSNVFDKLVGFREDLHIVEAYLEFAKALGLKNIAQELVPLQSSQPDRLKVDSNFPAQKEYVLLQVGTSLRAKSRRWEVSKWQELIGLLAKEHKIVLVGSKEEEEILSEISLPKSNIIDAVNLLSITQLAYLMQKSKLFIGLDTGTTHLAAAMGTPIVALYGPNTPDRWGPFSSNASVIYKKTFCSPCTRQHQGVVSNCQENKCMQQITVPEVIAAVSSATGCVPQPI